MKKLYLLLSILFLILIGCSIFQKEYDIDQLILIDEVYYKKSSDEIVDGKVFQIFGDMKMGLGYIKNGTKEGLWTWWFENGEKKNEGMFKDGKENGLHKWWYNNGHKSEERTYMDGVKYGLWTKWYDNGQKGIEGTYIDGLEFGLWTYYNEDGSIKEVKEY